MMVHLKKKAGDAPFYEMNWTAGPDLLDYIQKDGPVRVIKGRQYHLFKKESRKQFFSETFDVLSQSDRMGYRLKGPVLALEKEAELLSEAVSFGTIQVPSEGHPIVLLADRQTTGGYPKIGQVATADLSRMAQFKPGDQITFKEISHQEAETILLEMEEAIQKFKRGILLKWK
jgi:antagonist of KipI